MSNNETIPPLEQKTAIAYFDPFDVFNEIKTIFYSHLPLTNLHWNHPLRPLRTIPELDVDFIEETVQSQYTPKHQLLGMSPAPYLKIAFVKCDDTETYRSTIRKVLREWFAKSIEGVRDPTEWLIVHYVPQGGKASSGNRFKYGVIDKIKIDFNSGSKKDRVIQIKHDYASEEEKKEAWKDLIAHVKESVFDSFSTRVDVYQEEINKLEAERHVLGWNFGKFYVMKEGLALAFEQMNLFEDALLLYDELEASYGQRTDNRAISIFSSVGFDELPKPLLEMQKTNSIRHDILSNQITLFDFHCYLFGRQSYLLLCSAKTSTPMSIASIKAGELFLRLQSFLGETVGLLRSYKKPSQMISEWTFNVCEEYMNATSWANGGVVREVAEGRGEVILSKRQALEAIAKIKGWLIEGILSEVPLEDISEEDEKPYELVNKNMRESLESSDAFYSQYRNLTNLALQEFQVADQIRIQNRLTSQLALLEYQLGNFETAIKYLESIPSLYSRQGWDLISTSLLVVYVDCLKHFNRKEDLLINTLELLSRYVFLSSSDIKQLIETVQTLSETVSCSTNFDNYFKAEIDTNIVTPSDSDVYQLKIKIHNPLSNAFNIDTGTITMRNVNDSSDMISFEVSQQNPIVLEPGYTTLVFKNDRFEQIKFKVTALFFTQGRLTFTKNFTDLTPTLLTLYPTESNFHASFKTTPLVHLGERRIGLLISSGNNNIKTGKLTLKSGTTGLKLISLKAQNEKSYNEESVVSVSEGRPPVISFTNLKAGKQLMVTIPYVVDFDVFNVRLKASINYTTDNGDFQYLLNDTIDLSLALSVNVQDFYKGDRLFSKFSVSCNHADEPVRILHTDLKSTDTFITSSPSGTNKPSVSYPSGPVSFVFCIKKRHDAPVKNDIVSLNIVHRYVRSECLVKVEKAMEKVLENVKFDRYSLLVKKALHVLPINLVSYLQTGKVLLSKESWYKLRTAESLGLLNHLQREELIEYLSSNVNHYLQEDSLGEDDELFKEITHQLVIPVSVPQVHVVHNIELTLPPKDHFVVGKSIEAILRVSTVQNWTPAGQENVINETSRFVYSLAASENWAYSGKKKSFFRVSKDEQQFKVTMVPLRTGKLMFPKVEVQFLENVQSQISMETNYRNEYQFAVVVPEFKDKLTLTF